MTDATEAARRILAARAPAQLSHRDAHIVARALLAQHNDVVERCAQVADNLATILPRCEYEGGFQNACKLIASHIRALRTKP